MKATRLFSMRQMVFNLLAILIIIAMATSGSGPSVAAKGLSEGVKPPEPSDKQLSLMNQCIDAKGQITHQNLTGKINFVGTNPNEPIRQPIEGLRSATPEEAARGYLSQCGSLFGLSNQAEELSVKHQKKVEDGRSVLRFQQTYQTIPVFGGELVVQLNAANDILMVNGNMLPNIQLDTQASFDKDAAQQDALQLVATKYNLNSDALKVSAAELGVYSPILFGQDGSTSLVWRMNVSPIDMNHLVPVEELVLIDAHTGAVLLSINQVDEAMNRWTGDFRHGTSTAYLVCNESNPTCAGGDTHAVNAHNYAGDTYYFYSSLYGRDSLNNAGMTLYSLVHYSTNFCNAFWSNSWQAMIYGDGCFLVVDDVVAHEMTHAVTSYESNLVYSYQSGAINESLSDIFGEFMDLGNGKGNDTAAVRWLMGEDSTGGTWGNGALRDMKNPPNMSQPDRMGSPYYYTGSSDNGGVHTNSGVGNKAAYLIVDGDTFNGYTVNGIGIAKAAYIYYEVQTNILTSSSNYAGLGNALSQACNNLVGTHSISAADCAEVRKATYATEMVPPPPANDDFNTPEIITSLPYTKTQDTVGATVANDDPIFPCALNQHNNTVWYRYTPSISSSLMINTSGSSYDTVLAVWTGSRGSLTSIACDDDTLAPQSQVTFAAVAGVTYYIEAASYYAGGGSLTINIPQPTISGNVGVGGATISYPGGTSTTSQPDGSYSLKVPYNWSGTITPTKACYVFNPLNRSYSNVITNLTSQNYSYTLQSGAGCANVTIALAGVTQGIYAIPSPGSDRQSFVGANNGPVKLVGNVNIIAAQRILYYGTGAATSFVEMMGLPAGQLDTTYWFPWYKNDGIVDTQLRIGNVSASTATVHIYIAGVEVPGSPFTLTTSGAGQSQRLSFALNDGPVKVVSNVPIVTTERLIYFNSGVPVSFSEMMGLPNSQLSNTYWFPWYKNVGDGIDTQLRIGNVSASTATVHIYIGGVEMTGSPFTLTTSGAGQSQRLSFNANNGPVKIVSDVNIVAAQRILYYAGSVPTSFVETMGLPNGQLSTTHWFPWYKNVGDGIDTQIRIGNVSGLGASVHVYIGGVEMTGSPFALTATGAGQSLRLSFNANNGPVRLVSDQNIVASERLIYSSGGVATSFSEMMGLPNTQLSTTYWLPWYKNVGEIDTQLRFATP